MSVLQWRPLISGLRGGGLGTAHVVRRLRARRPGALAAKVEANAVKLRALRRRVERLEAAPRAGAVGGMPLGEMVAAHERTLQELMERTSTLADAGLLTHLHEVTMAHGRAIQGLADRLDVRDETRDVWAFNEWISRAAVEESALISVVMPTHNRAGLLPRAVASVLAQEYPRWELIIVDDDSSDDTPEVIASFGDSRIRSLRIPHGGCCAARNAALDVATGDIIAYLDDDNQMHPLWLKSVAWAFGQRPDVEVLYGAFFIDDIVRNSGKGAGGLPFLVLKPFDRDRLAENCLTDMSAIAHRAGLDNARFDESLLEAGDWDLLCSLTRGREPLVLPAIAHYYATDASGRLSYGPTRNSEYAMVRARYQAPVQ